MKRWDYNTLKGEIMLFFLFLLIMTVEAACFFYLVFFAEPVAWLIADRMKSPESVTILVWTGRVLAVFYMYLAYVGFRHMAVKNGKL